MSPAAKSFSKVSNFKDQILTERPIIKSRLSFPLYIVIVLVLLVVSPLRAADGDLDPSFGAGGRQFVQISAGERDFANAVAIQSDGKIVIGGELGDFGASYNTSVLIRLNPDGTLDQTFGQGGKVLNTFQFRLPALVIQPDGKIVTAATTSILGTTFDFAVARYNPDGTIDQTFGSGGYASNGNGHAESVILQPDGKIIIVGFLPIFRDGSDYLAARFNADGSPDMTFGVGGRVQTSFTSGRNSADNAYAGALQADGKLVLTGVSNGISPTMIRYNPDGSIDSGFGLSGTVLTPGFGAITRNILIQPDGKIVVAGGTFVLGRYNPNGTTDQSFGTSGRIAGGFGAGNGYANALSIQQNGKLLVAGSIAYTNTGNSVFALNRHNLDGSLDQTFGSNGFVLTEFTGALDEANALAVQANGRIVLAGYAAEPGASYHDFAIARYQSQISKWSQLSADIEP